jgi:iron complex outermembrane receptor protein
LPFEGKEIFMTRKKRRGSGKIWCFIPVLLLIVSTARAEEKITVKEVVVTATRYEEDISDVPADVSLIRQEDIKNSTAQNIPELLRAQAGIYINDITGNRRSYTVDLRGFGEAASSNTLVLVDGRRLNEPDLSGVDWTEIPLDRVSRIEIIRGGRGSVLYGDNATGGVINIITKEGAEGFKAGAEVAGGSYGTLRTNVYAGGGLKDLSVRLTGDYLTSDGYRDNSKTEAKDLGLNAGYYVNEYLKLDFSSGYHRDHTGLPGALKESDFAAGASRTDSLFPQDFSETEDYYFQLRPEVYFADDNVFGLGMSLRRRDFLSFSSGDWGNFLGDSEITTAALSPQVVLKQHIGQLRNSLSAGFDYQKTNNDIQNDSLFFGARTTGIFTLKKEDEGYYVHDELGTADIHLSGGYRYDRAKFSFDPSTPAGITMSRNVYTAGINYIYFHKSYAYVSYSRSFRYPLLDELYSFITNTINTALLPQTSDDYEFGIRHYFSDGFLAHVGLFRVDTDREIFFNPGTYQNENLDGKSRREGVEVSLDAAVLDWLTLSGSYTFTSAKIKEGAFEGKNVPNVPKHKAVLDVKCGITKEAAAILSGVYVGERPFVSDFANDFSDQKGYLLLNAKFSYHWKSLKAFLDINNLTNKEYSEYGVIGGFPMEKAFYPSPKRNFLVGLSIAF